MTPTTTTGGPTWREWTGLVLIALPFLMMGTDVTSMFLALPAVTADLTPTTTQMLWIVHIGEFVAAGMVITMGWLTGRIGPRALLLIAMAVYAISSTLAAFSANAEMLLASRVLIGLATAAAAPAGVAILRSLFTSPRYYGIGFAVVMGAFSVGASLGPPLAGLLLEYFWWGSVFLVNVPVAVLVYLLGLWLFPHPSDKTSDRIDIISVVTSMAAVMLVVYGLQELADQGYSLSYVLFILSGLMLGTLFILRQKRVNNPLLDLSLFSIRVLRVMTIVFLLSQVAFKAAEFVLIQYLQVVAGVPAGQLGLILIVPAVASVLATALIPVLIRWLNPSNVMAAGSVIATVGTLLVAAALTWAPVTVLVITGMTMIAFGLAPTMVLGAQLIVTAAPKKHAGTAAALQEISGSLGSAMGMVVFGSLSMAVFSRGLNTGAPDAVSDANLDAATESLGGAVAIAESIGGSTGAELVPVIHEAWSWGTIVVYAVAFVVGVLVTAVVVRGLRGAHFPSDHESEGDEDSAPADTPRATSRVPVLASPACTTVGLPFCHDSWASCLREWQHYGRDS